MEVIRLNLDEPIEKIEQGLVVALGYFDGIHKAHMNLIDEVIKIGKEKNLKTGIVTFHPHPAFVLNKKSITSFLTPLEVKIQLLEEIDLDYVFIVDFDINIAKIEHKEFVEKFFLPLNIDYVVAGFDNRYGFMGKGTVDTLKEDSNNSIEVVVIEELTIYNRKIGSTYIRDLLTKGDVKKVSSLLDRDYSIDGFIMHGRGRGKTIGVPTANLALKYPYEVPAKGVYVVRVLHDNSEYYGVCNIGNNPTFNYNENKTIEINIFDFDKDIYGQYMKVEFIERVRDEIKFNSINELVEQIEKDKKTALKLIESI